MIWIAWLLGAVIAFRALRALAHRLQLSLGLCRYHSPLLYTTGVGRRREIHLGTTGDFLQDDSSWRRIVLERLAEGLLALCHDVERGLIPRDIVFLGTSDLLRDETAHRLGFRASAPGLVNLACTLTAWTEVSLLRAALRRGPSRVRLRRVRRLRVRAGDLAARKHEIQRLRDRLHGRSDRRPCAPA